MALKTDYKADVFEGNRKYEISTDAQGKSEILDVTTYSQEGDIIGPDMLNAITGAINGQETLLTGIITVALPAAGWSAASGLYKQTVTVQGITAEDMPLLLKYTAPDASKDDSLDYGIDFALISGGQCAAGSVTFYATDTPDHDLTVALGLGKKGDGRLLMGGGGSGEKQQISNVVMTITDNAAVAEGGVVTAECNGKSWTSTIKNGKAKLYASEVGNYTITVVTTDAEPITYTTMLVCPYFGQFSTDIYSGTLMVTCTEEGGNGKSCNVRSCDDEYNATDAYNLTQTFDTGLELTFLGIPSGKYLVTVDGKYVFFKEIQSIQNINSVDVELKQWLYKHGDQCPWNTGGWMRCKVEPSVTNFSWEKASYLKTNAVSNANIVFLVNRIEYTCNCASNAINIGASGYYLYIRGSATAIAGVGTVNPLMLAEKTYQLHITGNDSVIACFRTGEANSEATQIDTATILQSGIGNGAILSSKTDGYLVIGNILNIPQQGSSNTYGSDGTSYSYNSDGNITEIYLV